MKYLLIILTVAGLFACEEAFEHDSQGDDNLLVVEALFTSERKRQEVRLSETFSNLNDTPPQVTNALVALNDGDTTILLQHDEQNPGLYLTDTMQSLFGKVYTLYIQYDDKEYYAQATSAFGTPLEPFDMKEADSSLFEFVYNESSEPSMMEVTAKWDDPDGLGLRKAFFYTLNALDINTIFAPEKQALQFPEGATVYRKKYSLTPDHQEFLRSALSEVDWRGGIFDVSAGNVKTNLSEGAVGYFSVSMVRVDSTFVQP